MYLYNVRNRDFCIVMFRIVLFFRSQEQREERQKSTSGIFCRSENSVLFNKSSSFHRFDINNFAYRSSFREIEYSKEDTVRPRTVTFLSSAQLPSIAGLPQPVSCQLLKLCTSRHLWFLSHHLRPPQPAWHRLIRFSGRLYLGGRPPTLAVSIRPDPC